MDSSKLLNDLNRTVKDDFQVTNRVLSFQEYMDIFMKNPRMHARNAAQYLVDCFEYYGRDSYRFRLFDCEFDGGKDRLIGHEEAQNEVFKILNKFTREGRISQLILIYGPNGSAKSTFISCIARAIESYSHLDPGAVYMFNWVFPSEKVEKKRLGFSEDQRIFGDLKSFAHLDNEYIDVKIVSEMKDHPLLLLPKDFRAKLLKDMITDTNFILSKTLLEGDLSPLSRMIFDSLLLAYQGDLEKVLQHVQVERFFLSRKFRKGIVTVEPQIHVDADARQITLNRSLESLPRVLQNLTLFEPFGDLVDANRGMIEFNDLLKKPVESYKYLLATCEKSTVSLPNMILHLDAVFFGTSNDKYLSAFMEIPDWGSFKGRIELVRMPYINNYFVEKQIYTDQITEKTISKHIAPHSFLIASMFAVLTRMNKPEIGNLPESVKDVAMSLTPLDKADFYADRRIPRTMSIEKANELKAAKPAFLKDGKSQKAYEGQCGASPREIKSILFSAVQNEQYKCLSPLSILIEIENLIKQKSVYEFLRVDSQGDYHNHARLLDLLKKRYIEIIDDEVKDSMGLVSESRYSELFSKYVLHASHHVRGEKVFNAVTGMHEQSDVKFMEEMENIFEIRKHPSDFRKDIISKIGAWSLAHAGVHINYEEIFPDLFEQMKQNFYKRHREDIVKIHENLFNYLSDSKNQLLKNEIDQVEQLLAALQKKYGYCMNCAREIMAILYREKYS
jgi:predicted Ser/Thr protein kinase